MSSQPEHTADYWEKTGSVYRYYPTVRHRKRFVLNALKGIGLSSDSYVFDYGCGEGSLLSAVRERFGLPDDHLAGCDIDETAVELTRSRINSPHIASTILPETSRCFDVVICSEVIEHTPEYRKILQWVWDHLKSGGVLILTTQSGRIHASDRYTGHTQHFKLVSLVSEMREIGFHIEHKRLWGFPLFSLQKRLTDFQFEKIQNSYLEADLTPSTRLLFGTANLAFFVHYMIPFGPQIFVVASRRKGI